MVSERVHGWRKLAGSTWGRPMVPSSTATWNSTQADCCTTSRSSGIVPACMSPSPPGGPGGGARADRRARAADPARPRARAPAGERGRVLHRGGGRRPGAYRRQGPRRRPEVGGRDRPRANQPLCRARRWLRSGTGPRKGPAGQVAARPAARRAAHRRVADLRPQPGPDPARDAPSGVRRRDDHVSGRGGGHPGVLAAGALLPGPLLVLVGAVRRQPVAVADEVVVRPVLTLTATFDHRYADGFHAARFAGAVR